MLASHLLSQDSFPIESYSQWEREDLGLEMLSHSHFVTLTYAFSFSLSLFLQTEPYCVFCPVSQHLGKDAPFKQWPIDYTDSICSSPIWDPQSQDLHKGLCIISTSTQLSQSSKKLASHYSLPAFDFQTLSWFSNLLWLLFTSLDVSLFTICLGKTKHHLHARAM